MRTLFRALVVTGALVGLVASGCGKEKLTEVAVPTEGVSLRYDLSKGQAYRGHLKVRSAAQTPMGELVQKLEFDVDLVVVSSAGDNNTVAASVDGMAFEMRLPDGFPEKMLVDQGFSQETAESLNGAEFSFDVSNDGTLDNMPEPPAGTNPAAQAFLGFVLAGLRAGLPRMPKEAVAQGESWDAVDPTRVEAGRTATGTGKLEGLARDEAGRDLAKLIYEVQSSGKAPGPTGAEIEIKTEATMEALFATSDGFPAKVDSTIKNEAAGQSIRIEVAVEWAKEGKREVSGTPTETQAVNDPCDPDYVGAEECPADADGSDVAEGAEEAEAQPGAEG